ncbi:MAG: PEP-CTERM sorting domain-containing protein [Verrucomicrobiota bacterium]
MQEKQNNRPERATLAAFARMALSIAAILVATTGNAPANLITNGDFEGGETDGVPNGWNFDDAGEDGAEVLLDSSTVGESAFTSGSQSARLPDGDTDQQTLYQAFDPFAGQLTFVFDFYLDDDVPKTAHWNAHLDGNDNQAFAYNIDHSDKGDDEDSQFTLVARGGDEAQDIVLDSETWYRVTTNLDTDTQTFSGTIESTSEVIATIGSKTFQNEVTAVDQVRFVDGYGGKENSPLNIDNVSVIPEPASLMLLALGGVALLKRRPRRW